MVIASIIAEARPNSTSASLTRFQLASAASISGCIRKKRTIGRWTLAQPTIAAEKGAVRRSCSLSNSRSIRSGWSRSSIASGRGQMLLRSSFQNRYLSPLASTKMWESITPPLSCGWPASKPRPVVLTGWPVISGSPLSIHGPVGDGARARPIASALVRCRAVKHSQYSSPAFAISGAQKSATLRPVAAQAGSRPCGNTNPSGRQCSRSSEWRIGKASGASLDVATR